MPRRIKKKKVDELVLQALQSRTQYRLAKDVGVKSNTVWRWVHCGMIPKPETREKLRQLVSN